jgi:PAS domain S-box-containing protein
MPLSSKQLSYIADYMPQIVWITNEIGELTYCNQRWVNYTGLSLEATLKGDWDKVVHPDDVAISFDAWANAIKTPVFYEAETRIKRASDNTYRWHLVRGFPVTDDSNKIVGWVGTSTDIDDLKNTQTCLQESEKHYSTLLQALHSIYWTIDPIGAATNHQPSWEEFSGQSFEEYQGFGWLDAIHPEDREGLMSAWQNAVAEKRIYQHVARFWSAKQHDYIYCIGRAAPLIDAHGEIIKWIGSCLDINTQKQAEKKLQELSDHLILALDSARAGTWSWDLITNKVIWDQTMYKLFGLTDFGSVNSYEDFKDLIHPLDREIVEQEVTAAIVNLKSGFDRDYRIIWPDGSIHTIASKGKCYQDISGKINRMIGVCFDITDQKRAEKEIHQNQLDFAHKSKISSISEIASSLAHELNQPISAISMFSQECVKQLENNNYDMNNILYALKETATQAHRAGEIIHRIKNSVERRFLLLKNTDFNEVIASAIKFINHERIDCPIKIEYQENLNLPLIALDNIQVQQVIINLIRNALEALQEHKTPSPFIGITYEINEDMLLTKVCDNGPGFQSLTEYKIDNIISTKTGGMGIGLLICRSIIEAHGGKLNLGKSTLGGALVEFKIPIKSEIQ